MIVKETNWDVIREAVRSRGPDAVAHDMARRLCFDRKSASEIARKFSLREAWEAFVGPVEDTLPRFMLDPQHKMFHESGSSTAFSIVTSGYIVRTVLDAYDAMPAALPQITTEYSSPNLRSEPIPAFSAFGEMLEVPEGQEYSSVGFGDRGVYPPAPMKVGRLIDITDEMIRFDQTGQVAQRAQYLAQLARMDEERDGIRVIQDSTAARARAFYPIVNGVGTQTDLYRSSAAGSAWYNKSVNWVTSNALQDWSDIDAAWQKLAAMTDEAGMPIMIASMDLLVPQALYMTALRIVNATELRSNDTTTPLRTLVSGNELRTAIGNVRVFTSPYMEDSTTWYFGDFRRQFFNRIVVPIEVAPLLENPRRDVVRSFRVRRMSHVFAVDDKFVIKNTA